MINTHRRKLLRGTVAGTALLAGCLGNGTDENGTGDGPDLEDDEEYEELSEFDWLGLTREVNPGIFELQEYGLDIWEELGLNLNLQVMEFSTLIDQTYNEGDYDIFSIWWTAAPHRLDPHYLMWHTYHTTGGDNVIGYDNEAYDELARQIKTTYDQDERIEYAHQAQEMIARDQPDIFVLHEDAIAVANEEQFTNWESQVGTETFFNVASLSQLEQVGDEDTVTRAAMEQPETLNPFGGATHVNQQIRSLFYSRLVYFSTDGERELRDATDIDVVDDTTIDVTLHDELNFHDGEPVTAEDVQFTVDYFQEYPAPYSETYTEAIESVEIMDDKVVRFNLTEPHAAFITTTLSQLNIIPKHIWDGVVEEEDIEDPSQWPDPDFTGSGPFEVSSVQLEDRIILEVNEDYPIMDFDFDTLVYRVYSSEATAYGDVEAGTATFNQDIQPTHYQQAQDDDSVLAVDELSHGFTPIRLNNSREPFNDMVFRQALSHAIDKEEVVNLLFQGHGQVASNPIAPANSIFYNDDLPVYDGGIEAARDLLEDAGYRWDDDGNLLIPVSRFEGDGPPVHGGALD